MDKQKKIYKTKKYIIHVPKFILYSMMLSSILISPSGTPYCPTGKVSLYIFSTTPLDLKNFALFSNRSRSSFVILPLKCDNAWCLGMLSLVIISYIEIR